MTRTATIEVTQHVSGPLLGRLRTRWLGRFVPLPLDVTPHLPNLSGAVCKALVVLIVAGHPSAGAEEIATTTGLPLMTTTADATRRTPGPLLDALAAAGADVTRPRAMRCPFHDDRHASAGMYHGQDGAWRFKCHTCGVRGDVFDMWARVNGTSAAAELRRARKVDGPPPAPRRAAPVPPRAPAVDWSAEHAKGRGLVHPGELYDFAEIELGLTGWSLDLLDVGADDEPGAGYLFPERDAAGCIIGLVRRTPDGRQRSLPGSRRGITFQVPLPDDDPVLVVEGASDTAAAIEAGFTAVGRPSNTGGGELLAELLAGRDVVVLGENDRKPDGAWPGREGAERIAERLRSACSRVRVLFPPEGTKDVRAWLGEKNHG